MSNNIYKYDEEKHKQPLFKYSLDKFYFIVHDAQLLIFEKNRREDNNV
jgi:hypothetical protein